VRWLRPEYQQQAPASALADEAGDDEAGDDATDNATATSPDKPAWPTRVAERVKLVKAALTPDTPLSAAELAARFTGADETSITETLDTLVELELAPRTAAGHTTR
jgi:hypothetical protein